MSIVKPEKKLYLNVVQAFGGAMITVGDFVDLVKRDKIPRDTILLASSDEEGNRFGYVYELLSDTLMLSDAEAMGVPQFADKRVVILMPAL